MEAGERSDLDCSGLCNGLGNTWAQLGDTDVAIDIGESVQGVIRPCGQTDNNEVVCHLLYSANGMTLYIIITNTLALSTQAHYEAICYSPNCKT